MHACMSFGEANKHCSLQLQDCSSQKQSKSSDVSSTYKLLPRSGEEWRCRFKITSHEECHCLWAPPVLNPYHNLCCVTKLCSHRLCVTSTASPPPVVHPLPPSPGNALPPALGSPTISSPLPLRWHRPHRLPFLLGVLHGGR
jgi:hypothetical protein